MKFDIIVNTYNLTEKTLECFTRIHKFTKNYRLIWIDNGSEEPSKSKVASLIYELKIPHVKFLSKENLGFVKGTNIGLGISTAPWKVLLNNDVYVTNNWLEQMASCAEINNYDMVGPVTSANGGQHQSCNQLRKKLRKELPEYLGSDIDDFADVLHKTMKHDSHSINNGMLAFFCTLIKSTVIKSVGYLSEDFGIGFGDDDYLCALARKAGFNIGIDLGTFVHHFHRSTFRDNYSSEEIATMQSKALATYKSKISRVTG